MPTPSRIPTGPITSSRRVLASARRFRPATSLVGPCRPVPNTPGFGTTVVRLEPRGLDWSNEGPAIRAPLEASARPAGTRVNRHSSPRCTGTVPPTDPHPCESTTLSPRPPVRLDLRQRPEPDASTVATFGATRHVRIDVRSAAPRSVAFDLSRSFRRTPGIRRTPGARRETVAMPSLAVPVRHA
jgi:hypothetical protein